MKKIIGIVLLILAVLSAINVASKVSHRGVGTRTGSRSYEAGHKLGMITAPILLGGVGIWLLLSSRRTGADGSEESGSGGADRMPPKVILWTVGGIGGVIVMFVVAGVLLRGSRNHASPRPITPLPSSSPESSIATEPGRVESPKPTESMGAYAVGEKVQANWAGKWIPGTITEIKPGGFSMMVQLEDARFKRPILLSTNQLRRE